MSKPSQHKIFVGPRMRRLRQARELSQTSMASALGISPSYLNLIESNQRPLSVALILKLLSVYNISPDDLQGDTDGTLSELKRVFQDSLLDSELPDYDELFEVVNSAPNVVGGILKLHQAYRRALDRLSELNATIVERGSADLVRAQNLPHLQVDKAIEGRSNYFDALDRAAEEIADQLPQESGLWSGLQLYLRDQHQVQVKTLPVASMLHQKSWFDRHSQRLFISDGLSWPERIEALATHIAFFALSDPLDRAVLRLNLDAGEARLVARFAMARYAALALILPYRRFLRFAEQMRYDVEALAARFGLSFSQIGWRLTNLQRAGETGLPFAAIQMDFSGHYIRRAGSNGFPEIDFGGGCARLSHFSAAQRNDGLVAEGVETRRGEMWLTLSKTCQSEFGVYNGSKKGHVFLLICNREVAEKTIYADVLARPARAIGPNCRLCEIPHCVERYEAPLTRSPALDETMISISAFDFKA